MIKLSEREFGVTLSDEAKREPPVRTEPHPTRRTSQTFLNFVPFGTDNDFSRPSGTGCLSASIPGTSCVATIGLSLRDKTS
jgi:hypothetical protein